MKQGFIDDFQKKFDEAFKEFDDVVKKKQELDKIIGEVVDIQRKMMMK